jgi:hypothetical protein
MASLRQTAQVAMDLYYRDYKSDDAFLDVEHFERLCTAAYNHLVYEEYRENKILNTRLMGFSAVSLSQDWLRRETFKVQEDAERKEMYVELPGKPFSFPFDTMASGIQHVRPLGSPCTDFIRVSPEDEFHMCAVMPRTRKVFWFGLGDRIVIKNYAHCKLKEVEVAYVPKLTDDPESQISDAKEMAVITTALNLALAARNGNVIDTTNNSNPNTLPQTETDLSALNPG